MLRITLSGGHPSPVSGDARYMSQPAPLGTTDSTPPACDLVAIGDSVDVTAGLVCTRGVVVGMGPSRLTISLAGAIETDVTTFSLTRTDHDGAAWTAECPGHVLVGARRLEITERVGWIAVDRRSARVHADRRSVHAEWEEGRQKQQLRGLVAMDVSSSGCRLSGIGAPPPSGANLRLDISGTTYGESQWLSAEVMRVETSAFGRYLLGLRFQLETPDDYARVLAWREASLRR
jgi:hypothetical protein